MELLMNEHFLKHVAIFGFGLIISMILVMLISAYSFMYKNHTQTRVSSKLEDATLVKAVHKDKEYILINPKTFKQAVYIMFAGTWWFMFKRKKCDVLPKNEKAETVVFISVLLVLIILSVVTGYLMTNTILYDIKQHEASLELNQC